MPEPPQPTNGAASPARGTSLAAQMAARLGRDSMAYAIGTSAVFPVGLLTTAISTRFLTKSQFGVVGVLFFWSGMLTLLLNSFILRGTQLRVWASGDDGVVLNDADAAETSRRPMTLGTGLIASFGLSVIACVTICLLSRSIAVALFSNPHLRWAVIWAGVSASVGAIWRVSVNILRWERRPLAFGLLYGMRPVVALAVSWPLLAAGYGVGGAVAGVAIATVVGLAASMIAARGSWELKFEWQALIEICRAGIPLLGVIIGLAILHSADVYLVSAVSTNKEAGLFRLAGNMTSIISYAVSAFMLAWAPLETSSLFHAAYQYHGRRRLRGKFVDYYLMVGTLIVVVLSIVAPPAIDVLAPGYGRAVPLVPVTGVGFLTYGLLMVIVRGSEFPHRWLYYGFAALFASGMLVATSLVLGPSMGAYGVAIGDTVGAASGTAIIIGVALWLGKPPPVYLPRSFGILAIGGLCYVVGVPLAGMVGPWRIPLAALAVLMFPVLLVLTRIIPAAERRQLGSVVRLSFRSKPAHQALLRAFRSLPAEQQRLVLGAARDHRTASELQSEVNMSDHDVKLSVVQALRKLTGTGSTGPYDAVIGEMLLSRASITEKDSLARKLREEGVSPTELHALITAFEALQAAPSRAWLEVTQDAAARLPSTPAWPLPRSAIDVLDRVLRRGYPRPLAAAEFGVSVAGLDHHMAGALRRLAAVRGDRRTDSLVCQFVFDGRTPALARQLWAAGVDPVDLHELELIAIAIRSMHDAEWAQIEAVDDAAWAALGNGKQLPRAERYPALPAVAVIGNVPAEFQATPN